MPNAENRPPQGKMSEVYFANIYLPNELGVSTSVRVAVKRPLDDDEVGELVGQEFEIMQKMNHPNIMRPLAKFSYLGIIGYVMRAIKGINMNELAIQLRHSKDSKELARVLGDIMVLLVPALVYMHSVGIAHRDLKPQNVLIEVQDLSDGTHVYTPIICDFGLAIPDSSGQKSYKAAGTPLYIPMEYMYKQYVTVEEAQAADVYALGLMIVESVTGWTRDDYFDEVPKLTMNAIEKFGGQPLRAFVEAMIEGEPEKRTSMQGLYQFKWLQQQFEQRGIPIPNSPL